MRTEVPRSIQVGKWTPRRQVQVISKKSMVVDTIGLKEITQVEVKKKRKDLRMKPCV